MKADQLLNNGLFYQPAKKEKLKIKCNSIDRLIIEKNYKKKKKTNDIFSLQIYFHLL